MGLSAKGSSFLGTQLRDREGREPDGRGEKRCQRRKKPSSAASPGGRGGACIGSLSAPGPEGGAGRAHPGAEQRERRALPHTREVERTVTSRSRRKELSVRCGARAEGQHVVACRSGTEASERQHGPRKAATHLQYDFATVRALSWPASTHEHVGRFGGGQLGEWPISARQGSELEAVHVDGTRRNPQQRPSCYRQ